jgi:lipoyl(octanoyl) transferase
MIAADDFPVPGPEPREDARRLSVWLGGRTSLDEAVAASERLAWEVSEPSGRGPTLVLSEIVGAISIGRGGSRADVSLTDDELRKEGAGVRFVGRGGGAVAHVEGQVAIGLHARLEDLGLPPDGVGCYLARFQEALAGAIRTLRCSPVVRPGVHGVFGRSGLLAAVGVAVRRSVVSHGGFLNVCPSMRLVHRIRSTADGPMGSIEADLQRRARPAEVRSAIVQSFADAFGFARTNIHSGFPHGVPGKGVAGRSSVTGRNSGGGHRHAG